jgi:hypothetical protein
MTARFILMQMVLDKQTKMRETLKIMSMKTGAYGLSYFLSQVFFVVFTTVVFAIMFVTTNTVTLGNGLIMVFALLLQGLALLLFSMSISTLFSDPRLSVQLGSLLLFLPLTLFIGLFNIDKPNPWRLYFGYMFPQFPTTVLVAKLCNI